MLHSQVQQKFGDETYPFVEMVPPMLQGMCGLRVRRAELAAIEDRHLGRNFLTVCIVVWFVTRVLIFSV